MRKREITLSEQAEAWLKARIAAGEFDSLDAAVDALIERERREEAERREEVRAIEARYGKPLESLIQEGIDSGLGREWTKELLEEKKRALRAEFGAGQS